MAAKSRKPTAPKKRQKISRTQRKSARPKLVQPPADALAKAQDLTVAGVHEQQAGNLDKAAAQYRKALKCAPDYPHALHFLGVVHHQKGQHKMAAEMIRRAITLEPAQAKFYNNLATVQVALGDKEGAVASLRSAAEIDPSNTDLHLNLGTALRKLGDWDRAIECYRQAPQEPIVLKRLGEVYNFREHFDESIVAHKRYLELVPDDPEIHNNLAYAYEKSDRMEQAEEHYRRAADLRPDMPEIAHNLGVVLRSLGREEEAETHLQRAREATPESWGNLSNLAAIKATNGHTIEAIEIYERLLESDPDNAGLLNDYGMVLGSANRALDAIKYLNRSIEINPKSAIAYSNRAVAKSAAYDRIGAVEDFMKALSLMPGMLHALVQLSTNLTGVHRYDEAYFYARSLLMAEGYVPKLYANPHKVFRTLNDFDAIEELGDIWAHAEETDRVARSTLFLELLVLTDTREKTETVVRFHREWREALEVSVADDPMTPAPPRQRTGKARLGFLSADLRSHSVAKFIMPLFKHLDRDKFEIFCYSPVCVPTDVNQQRFEKAVDKFRFVHNRTDRQIAEIIRDDEVDILFDLHGFTQGSRLGVLARRPAPVQVEWLGYPFTTGMKEMDYFLLDPYCRPEEDSFLAETVLEMPESWICFGEYPDDMILGKLPHERNDGLVTFGTLNNPYKFTPQIYDLWARILAEVPNSRFLIVRRECKSKVFVSNVCKEFQKRGIGPERLNFVNNVDTTYQVDDAEFTLSHVYYYDEIDISLDTFPVTGGTTTCDALWMGVPVVSLMGPSLHQRISYSILKNLDLGDLCHESPDEYVRIAVDLANDPDRLRDIRQNTREKMRASPLCDAARFAENFQKLMLEVVERHNLR